MGEKGTTRCVRVEREREKSKKMLNESAKFVELCPVPIATKTDGIARGHNRSEQSQKEMVVRTGKQQKLAGKGGPGESLRVSLTGSAMGGGPWSGLALPVSASAFQGLSAAG
jgi:hypothetical protein